MFLYSSGRATSPYCGRLSTNVKGTAPTTTSYSRAPSAHLYMNMGDEAKIGGNDDLVQQDAERPPVVWGKWDVRSGVTGRLRTGRRRERPPVDAFAMAFHHDELGREEQGVPDAGRGGGWWWRWWRRWWWRYPQARRGRTGCCSRRPCSGTAGPRRASSRRRRPLLHGPHTAAAAALAYVVASPPPPPLPYVG